MKDFQILVVDDDEMVAEYLYDIFTGADSPYKVKVTVLTDSFQASELIDQKLFDVISLDHKMPEFTGRELITRIRSEDHVNRNTPIIFFSGFHDSIPMDNLTEDLDGVYFVDKPDVNGRLENLARIFYGKDRLDIKAS